MRRRSADDRREEFPQLIVLVLAFHDLGSFDSANCCDFALGLFSRLL
jgi:hypothetical protein